jgi:hypothetical protein
LPKQSSFLSGTVEIPLLDVLSEKSLSPSATDAPKEWYKVMDADKQVGEINLSVWWSDKSG